MAFNEGDIYKGRMISFKFLLIIFTLDLLEEELGSGGFAVTYKLRKIWTK
jgi:hypothetical protein